MAKYRAVLVRGIEAARKNEEEQETLRKESGIKSRGYRLKEKSRKRVAWDVLKKAAFMAYAALAFIGAVMLLYPASRAVLLRMFRLA